MNIGDTEIRFGVIKFQEAIEKGISKETVLTCHNLIWQIITKRTSNKAKKSDFVTPTANGKKPDDTFIDKWFTTIAELQDKDSDWIYDEIDWTRTDRFAELGVTVHQPKIRRSTRWADAYILDRNGLAKDTYGYVKWANYLLNNISYNLLDMDLWVLATTFVDRQANGKPINDLDDWIS